MKKAFNINSLIGEATAYDKKQELELKKVKSWCKTISAFANGIGGKIIFGITDNDTIVGLDNPKLVGEKFSEIVKNHIDPLPDIAISFDVVDDKPIMIAEVSAGVTTPYYYKGDGQMTAFVRLGNESVPASVMEIRELVLRGTHQSFDSLVSNYHFKDYDFAKLRAVFKARTGKPFDENDYESWGIVTENGMLTNAGALLADDSPIRQSRIFCTRWNGLDKANGLMDALDDIEVSGSLAWLLQSGLDFCRRNYQKRWYKTANGRVELPDYPDDSILEGLVNALIHRSYLEIGSEVHIDMFDDRIEIYSPGGMFDGKPVQDHELLKVKSKRRNPVIADIFSRLRYMERRGSGFKKICDNYHIQPHFSEDLTPIFFSDKSEFTLTLWNLNYGSSKFPKVPQSSPKFPKVPQTAYSLLEQLRITPSATVTELGEALALSSRMIKKYLKILKEVNAITRVGSNRHGYWQINRPEDMVNY
ncbi:MAG: putative DNA binding domain-containing protein [Muribaculaceae bacterium]|nr:putative DNA binding domain-containing protein [Muribaculaceae bacterium]